MVNFVGDLTFMPEGKPTTTFGGEPKLTFEGETTTTPEGELMATFEGEPQRCLKFCLRLCLKGTSGNTSESARGYVLV